MSLAPHTSFPNRRSAWAALPAATETTVRDGTTDVGMDGRLIAHYPDRLDLANVEHVRQDRLRRWQKPADPTRKAAQP